MQQLLPSGSTATAAAATLAHPDAASDHAATMEADVLSESEVMQRFKRRKSSSRSRPSSLKMMKLRRMSQLNRETSVGSRGSSGGSVSVTGDESRQPQSLLSDVSGRSRGEKCLK